jgi:hypothetical protein
MATKPKHPPQGVVVLFAWIFALLATGCGVAAESTPARAPEGGTASAGWGREAKQEATADAALQELGEAPAEAPDAAPMSLSDEAAVAQAGPTRGIPKSTLSGVPSPAPAMSSPPPAPTPTASPATPPVTSAGREPLLIYTATMTLAVFGTREALVAVEELARSVGGYLVSRGDESVTIRVPTKAFQGALGGVGKLGDELHREVNVRDVTEQFADLEIRLKNAEAVRQRLEGLLAKAGRIEDALAVERELERVTQTIEQLKGRLRLLGELVAFSTITVNFRPRPQDRVGTEVRLPFPWLGELGLVPLMNLEAQ